MDMYSGFISLFGLLLGLFLIVVIYVILANSVLFTLEAKANKSWSILFALFERRHQVIGEIIKTSSLFITDEELLQDVVLAKNAALTCESPGEQSWAEHELKRTLQKLFLVFNQNHGDAYKNTYSELYEEYYSIEQTISAATKKYNSDVSRLNRLVYVHKNSVLFDYFGFEEKEQLKVFNTQTIVAGREG